MQMELEMNIFWQQNRKNCGDSASEGDLFLRHEGRICFADYKPGRFHCYK
jgi:hypothetical protein